MHQSSERMRQRQKRTARRTAQDDSLCSRLGLIRERTVARLELCDKLVLDVGRALTLFRENAKAQMLVGRAERNIHDIVVYAFVGILRNAYRVKIGARKEPNLLHAIVDIGDFCGVIEIHNAVLGRNVVKKVLVLPDVAHKAVV